MDYFAIGQRIRHFRKAQNLSQEQLAEKIGISVTHMSHIETGNTKLSLPVLVDLAKVLQVRTDDLLLPQAQSDKPITISEIAQVLDSSTPSQAKVLRDVILAAKQSMDKNL